MMDAVACPDPVQLEALATGQASHEHRASLEVHIDTCADCAQTVAQLARIYGESRLDRSALAVSGDGDSLPPPAAAPTGPTVGR